MKPKYITEAALSTFITSAFKEDVGEGDHSTLSAVPEDATNHAKLVFKQPGIAAGIELATIIFHHFDPTLKVTALKKDGDFVDKGETAVKVSGAARSLLTAERLVLNCMQRMSGIATYTRQVAQSLEGTNTRLLDTRKTTPNFRMLEKWAVNIGGGGNHRFGLFDLIMLKDNHIDFSGGISAAVNRAYDYVQRLGKPLRIEVETRNLEEVQEALDTAKVDIIMFDNMDTSTMKAAVAMVNGQCKTEASGGIIPEQVRHIAECGVDFISMGALTYAAPVIDISMRADT